MGPHLHLTRESLPLIVVTPACTCLQPGLVGNLEGFSEEGMLQLRRPGSTGSPWGPSSCLHQSRSLRRRHPSGPLGRLIPEVPLSCGHLAVVHLFFARSVARWRAIFGRLLAPLTDAFREVNDLAALRSAMATVGVHRA
jgi:hypothetical protein